MTSRGCYRGEFKRTINSAPCYDVKNKVSYGHPTYSVNN